MDFSDQATAHEEKERACLIAAARRPVNPTIASKRRTLAEARLLAHQRGAEDPEFLDLNLDCENGCGEPLTVENDDIFCCKECAADWQRRDRARIISGG